MPRCPRAACRSLREGAPHGGAAECHGICTGNVRFRLPRPRIQSVPSLFPRPSSFPASPSSFRLPYSSLRALARGLSPTYAHAPCPTTPQLNGSTLIPGIVMDYSPARRQRMLFSGRGRCFPKTDFLIFYHVGALFPAEPDEDKHRRPLKAWEFLQAVSSWLSSFLSLSFAGRRREKRSGLSCPVSRKDPRRHLGAFFSPAALEVAVLHIGAL